MRERICAPAVTVRLIIRQTTAKVRSFISTKIHFFLSFAVSVILSALFVILSAAKNLFLRQDAFGDVLVNDALGELAEALGAQAVAALAAAHLRRLDAVRLPVRAPVGVVEQQRLEVVHHVREAGFRRAPRLELVEERRQLRALVLRQQRIDALLGGLLARLLRLQARRVISIRVARVNLHDVVDQAHHHHPRDVHGFVGVFAQQPRHRGHVPGVLRVVLGPPAARQVRLPEDILLLVDLEDEAQLLLKTCHTAKLRINPAFCAGSSCQGQIPPPAPLATKNCCRQGQKQPQTPLAKPSLALSLLFGEVLW